MGTERRVQRSTNISRALELQLCSSLREAPLTGIVLSDEDGVPLAQAGDRDACEEVAARLPLLGQTVSNFEGVLLSQNRGYHIEVERLQAGNSLLFLCAIGGRSRTRGQQLFRSKGGVERILANGAA